MATSVDPGHVPTYEKGDILFLVRIPLACALELAWHFLIYTISCEAVVGFLPNFHGRNWDITKSCLDFGDHDFNFQKSQQ